MQIRIFVRSYVASVMYGSAIVLLGGIWGCKGLTDLGGKQSLPSGVQDPATFRTPAGALAMQRAVIADFQQITPGMVADAGLLTDELQDHNIGGSALFGDRTDGYALDARLMGSGTCDDPVCGPVYDGLHLVRRDAVEAIGALQKYDSAAHPVLQGEAYALAGYAEIFLADLFCSGVPLSTIVFEGDYVYRPGSTTSAIYQHAITLFDSALVVAKDSTHILNLARVGKGRALLDLGDYAEAATAVASVPDTFQYTFPVLWASTYSAPNTFLASITTVADHEGINGLAYRSSGDPRTAVVSLGTNQHGTPLYFPAKYGGPNATAPLVVASGVEARLIEAEAMLQAHDVTGWLTRLNHLRETAIVPALPDLQDPGPAAQVDTMFAERAAWLFVTGTRQGDLRRLIRQYGRLADDVYPRGLYPGFGGRYGTEVNAPVPNAEKTNPLFTGCFNRGA